MCGIRWTRATAVSGLAALAFLVVATAPKAAVAAGFEWGNNIVGPLKLIEIPKDYQSGTIAGPADPYPAKLKVFGLGRKVLKLRVGVASFVHTEPDDVDILLVAPSGERTMLTSDACGTETIEADFLSFDNDAPAPLPTSGCVSGLYQPTNYAADGSLPAPAPPPDGFGGLFYSADLTVFDGVDPNGVWELFVFDDGFDDPQNGGIGLLGSWALQFRYLARCRGRRTTLEGVDRRGDFLVGRKRRDVIQAFGGSDFVAGKRRRDLLCGGKGKDNLFGGGGPDVLLGGKGRDRLVGGKGRDLCIGGPGHDTAVGCERRRGI